MTGCSNQLITYKIYLKTEGTPFYHQHHDLAIHSVFTFVNVRAGLKVPDSEGVFYHYDQPGVTASSAIFLPQPFHDNKKLMF